MTPTFEKISEKVMGGGGHWGSKILPPQCPPPPFENFLKTFFFFFRGSPHPFFDSWDHSDVKSYFAQAEALNCRKIVEKKNKLQ